MKPIFCTILMAIALAVVLLLINQSLPVDASRWTYTAISVVLTLFAMIIYGVALLITGTIGEQEIRLLPMGAKLTQLFTRLKLLKTESLS